LEIAAAEARSAITSALPSRLSRRAVATLIFVCPVLFAVLRHPLVRPDGMPVRGLVLAAGWSVTSSMTTIAFLLRSRIRERLALAPLEAAQRAGVIYALIIASGWGPAWVAFWSTSQLTSRSIGGMISVAVLHGVASLGASLLSALLSSVFLWLMPQRQLVALLCSSCGGLTLMLVSVVRLPTIANAPVVGAVAAATAMLIIGHLKVGIRLWQPLFEAEGAPLPQKQRTALTLCAWFAFLLLQFAIVRDGTTALAGLAACGAFPVWYRMSEEYRSPRWRVSPGARLEAVRVFLGRGVPSAGLVGALALLGPRPQGAILAAGATLIASACFLHLNVWVRWTAYAAVMVALVAILPAWSR
jgi:hypothetical protein